MDYDYWAKSLKTWTVRVWVSIGFEMVTVGFGVSFLLSDRWWSAVAMMVPAVLNAWCIQMSLEGICRATKMIARGALKG